MFFKIGFLKNFTIFIENACVKVSFFSWVPSLISVPSSYFFCFNFPSPPLLLRTLIHTPQWDPRVKTLQAFFQNNISGGCFCCLKKFVNFPGKCTDKCTDKCTYKSVYGFIFLINMNE